MLFRSGGKKKKWLGPHFTFYSYSYSEWDNVAIDESAAVVLSAPD